MKVEFKFVKGECFKVQVEEGDWDSISILNKIPGAKFMKKGGFWKLPISLRIYKQLKESFDFVCPTLESEHIPYIIASHQSKTTLRAHQKEAVQLSLKEMGFNLLDKRPKCFKDFECLCDRGFYISRGFALFMEMGTGKTLTAISIADTLHVNGFIKKALVIAPLPIVDIWGNSDPEVGELAKHSAVQHLTFTATGNKKTKEAALSTYNNWKTPAMKWLLINPESIGRIRKIKKKKELIYAEGLEEATPDIVIIDESTIIANQGTARGELIVKLFYHAPYKLILSGNPTPKGGHQIYGQYLFMDQGIYGNNFFKFREKYFNLDYFKGIAGMKPEEKDEFDSLFHSGCYIARKKDCLDLPPKVYERRHYEMSKEQTQTYKDMHKHAVAAFDDLSCTADVVITKYLRLSQIAGGYLPLEDEDGKLVSLRRFKEQPGLDLMVVDLLSLPSGEQVVIWARFQEEIEMVSERLTKEGITNVCFYGPVKVKDRIEARRKFREEEVRAFISSSAGARGLNDLIGATYVFYYSNDYSADRRQQSEDRNHRSGTEGDKVTYVDYIAHCPDYKHQIDEEVLTVLQSNKDYSTALLEQRKAKKVQQVSD